MPFGPEASDPKFLDLKPRTQKSPKTRLGFAKAAVFAHELKGDVTADLNLASESGVRAWIEALGFKGLGFRV